MRLSTHNWSPLVKEFPKIKAQKIPKLLRLVREMSLKNLVEKSNQSEDPPGIKRERYSGMVLLGTNTASYIDYAYYRSNP